MILLHGREIADMNREQEVLEYICAYRAEKSFSPTIREIGEGIGLRSISSVQKYIHSLMDKGCLERTDGTARTLVPLKG